MERIIQKPVLLPENCWYVTRYHDVKFLMEEENSSKDFLKWIDLNNAPTGFADSFQYKEMLKSKDGGIARGGFNLTDNPEHTEDLQNFMYLFSGKNIIKLTSVVKETVNNIVKNNINNANFDLVNDLGNHITNQVASNLLGIPEITELINVVNSHAQVLLDNVLRPEWLMSYSEKDLEDFEIATDFFVHFLTPIIIDRLENPKDDFLSNYLKSKDANIVKAGVYTTTLICLTHTVGVAIENILYFLANNKEIQQQLRQKKQLNLNEIEELIRFVGPNLSVIRILKKDITIDNVFMKKGMVFIADLLTANFDPEVFSNPTELNFNRSFKTLSFSHGIHACAGRALGNSALRVAVEEVLANTTDLKTMGEPTLKNNGAEKYFTNAPFLLENSNG
jgi:cytochrome P450